VTVYHCPDRAPVPRQQRQERLINPITRTTRLLAALALVSAAGIAVGGPFVPAGDLALRHDIQRLADHGIITGAVTTWPLAWGPVLADIRRYDGTADLPPDVRDAITRIEVRARWETRTNEVTFNAEASVAESPTRIRGYQHTPREQGEIGLGFNYTGDLFAVSLNGQAVADASDGEEFRADGSFVGVVLGNYAFTANTLERWWGPGWDGSLILGNNARPIPSVSIDRMHTDAFETRWLSWLGPWDLSVHFGRMESDRYVPEARFFGMRFNFRPIPSLEIGLTRSAQWCGEGRPCGLDTFWNLLIGRDNRGGEGIDVDNEPGNQLAGVDWRWSRLFGSPLAFYGQAIGEDEAGGFPSRYLGQLGIEGTGMISGRWSYRWFGELAETKCDVLEPNSGFDCAYNHSIYQTGYRYRGRSVGHGADNDARLLSAGVVLVDTDETQWQALVRYGALNRGGNPDPANTLTPTRQDIASLDLVHVRMFKYGRIDIGLGMERAEDDVSGQTSSDFRGYLQWRSAY